MDNLDYRIIEITRIFERPRSNNWYMENICYGDEYVITFVLNGETEYMIDDKKYLVNKNDVLLFPPKILRSGKTSPLDPWSFISIIFRMEHNEAAQNYFHDSIHIWRDINSDIRKQFKEATKTWLGKHSLYQVKCNLLTTDILYKLLLSEMPYHNVPHIKKLEQARTIIQDNFRNNLSVEELAESTGLSASYFRRLFNEAYGCSPMQYIMNLRIENARELLLSGEVNVTEAAQLSGFDDIYYFSTLFKRKTGSSPIQILRKL